MPAFAVHELLATVHAAGAVNFTKHFLGDNGNIGLCRFWANAVKYRWGREHPAVLNGGCERLLPVTVHIDGFEVYASTEYYAWTISCVLVGGDVFDVKLPILLLERWQARSKRVMREVMSRVCAYLAHCFHWASKGIGPHVGFYGHPFKKGSYSADLAGNSLAGGWRMCFIGQRGDMKARAETHQFKRKYDSTLVCESCDAVQWKSVHTDLTNLFTDFTALAPHLGTKIDHETYVRTNPASLSPWVQIEGSRLELWFFDAAHIDLLGIGKDLGGSTIIEFLEEGSLGHGEKDELLQHLQDECKEWCKANSITPYVGKLTMAALGRGKSSKEYPEFPSCMKAANTKIFNAFLAKKASDFDWGTPHTQLRRTCLWAYNEWHYVLDGADLILTDDQAAAAYRAGSLFLLAYGALASEAVANEMYLWKLRPKHHYFQHMVEFAAQYKMNPRKLQCLADEDYLGKIKRVCKQLHKSNVCLRYLQRAIQFLSLRWEERRNSGQWS